MFDPGEGAPLRRGLFGDEPQGLARVVDCRRLGSPWSTARLAAMLTMLPPGEVLEILTIDPTDLGDIEAWCRGSGMHLLSSHSLHGTYLLRVASDDPQSLAATH